ncbi:hypothetical protein C8R43DRAFT_882687, partial [Mycena crocata]
MRICFGCSRVLRKKIQPVDALANFQYYARAELPKDVKEAFEQASLYDLMMVSRSRATRITHMFCEKPDARGADKHYATSQGFSQGNVAIFAQDVAAVRDVLPPAKAEIREAMYALFIGPHTAPMRDNIKELKPVLVSKNCVQVIVDFLLSRNAYYLNAGIKFSQRNLDDLFPERTAEAFPAAIDICCLPDEGPTVPESYADRGDQIKSGPRTLDTTPDDGSIVLDAIGYTVGENTPSDSRGMKAAAVAWCLDKKNFIKMQSGSKFITDRDPGLLTFTFPALDPWGIGGFYEPNR